MKTETMSFIPAYWQARHWDETPAEERSPEVLAALRMMDREKFKQADHAEALEMFSNARVDVSIFLAAGNQLPEIPANLES